MVTSYQGKLTKPMRDEYPTTQAFMTRSFVTVSPQTDIYEAMDTLLKNKVSGAMVVDQYKNLVGIISEKDCLKLACGDTYDQLQPGGPVENYMTQNPITIDTSTGLAEVAELFLGNPYRKLPVLKDGRLIGVVRRRDVLAAIREFFGKRSAFLRTM